MTGKEILEQLGKLGVDGMKEISAWVEGAKDFVVEQAPLICQEIVARGTVNAIIWLISWIILFGVAGYLMFYSKKKRLSAHGDEEDGYTILFVFTIMGLFGFFVGIMYQTYMICYIRLCPRLYVLEELAKIVKMATK